MYMSSADHATLETGFNHGEEDAESEQKQQHETPLIL